MNSGQPINLSRLEQDKRRPLVNVQRFNSLVKAPHSLRQAIDLYTVQALPVEVPASVREDDVGRGGVGGGGGGVQ